MADQDGHKLGGGGPVTPNPASPAPANHAPPGAPSGQFHASGDKLQVDFGEAQQALKHLDAAREELTFALNNSDLMSQIKNPGRESPSEGYAGLVNPVGRAQRDAVKNKLQAVEAAREALSAQLASYQRTEQSNATNLDRNRD